MCSISLKINSVFINIAFKKCWCAKTWTPCLPISQKWPADKLEGLYPQYLITTWHSVSVSVSVIDGRSRPVITVRTLRSKGEVLLSGLLFIQPSLNPPLLPLHMEEGGRSFSSVMEVCIDPARRWGWNTNRVNRINGAVTLGWGGVPDFSLPVCRLIAFCLL